MDMNFSESEKMLLASARCVFTENAPLQSKLSHEKTAQRFDSLLWKKFVELGWMSAACDGHGDSLIMLGIMAQEIGRFSVATPFIKSASAALLLNDAEHENAANVTQRFAEAGSVLIPVGIEAAQPRIPLHRKGGDYVCTFSDRLVDWAPAGDVFVVVAWIDDEQPAALLIDSKAVDLEVTSVETFDATSVGFVTLEEMRIPEDQIVTIASSAQGLEQILGITRLLDAVEAVGGAEGALDVISHFVRERRQFGRAIGSFQAIQHGLADVKVLIEGASLATWFGLSEASQNRSCVSQSWLAVWSAQRAFQEAVLKGSLYHGGMGHVQESEMQFYYRRAGTSYGRLGSQWHLLGHIADAFVDPFVNGVCDQSFGE